MATSISNVPELITLADTNETQFRVIGRVGARKKSFIFRFPSTNAGTVKINTKGNAADSLKTYAAGDTAVIDIWEYFNAKASSANDKFSIE